MTNKTILIIEDNYEHFTIIKSLLESKDWTVLPEISNGQSELNKFLYGTVTNNFKDRIESASKIKEQISKFIISNEKYKYLSVIILDIRLSSINDENLEEGYSVLNEIRNMYIDSKEFRGWNKVVPIIILSQYKENVKKALKGKAITNLCLNKDEVFGDTTMLTSYLEHIFNYFEIVKNNLVDYNSLNTELKSIDNKLDHSNYRLAEILDNIEDLAINTSFLIEAAFHKLKPSQRQELIDKFDDYLPTDIKDKFGATYFDKLKEDLKQNVDNIDLFVKTLEYAPITIFTTLRDIIMNIGVYKL